MSKQSSGLFATMEGRECRRRPGTRLRVVAEAGSTKKFAEQIFIGDRVPLVILNAKWGNYPFKLAHFRHKNFCLIFIKIIRYVPSQVCRYKIHSCVVGLLVGFLTSSPTHADFYINSKTGIAITENITNSADINSTFHIGMTLGGSVGYKFPDIFRLEAESTYRRARVHTITNKVSNRSISSDGHIASVSFLGNGFLDIPIYQKLFGSIGGGLGFSKIHVKIPTNAEINTGTKDDDSAFCYQANAGLGYKWLDYLETSLNYGYFETLKASFQDFNGARWNASNGRTHDVIIQVRYFF